MKSVGNSSNLNTDMMMTRTMSMPEKREIYQPKNSTVLEEKIIERNGKQVLVKKYSVTENGRTHKETH